VLFIKNLSEEIYDAIHLTQNLVGKFSNRNMYIRLSAISIA